MCLCTLVVSLTCGEWICRVVPELRRITLYYQFVSALYIKLNNWCWGSLNSYFYTAVFTDNTENCAGYVNTFILYSCTRWHAEYLTLIGQETHSELWTWWQQHILHSLRLTLRQFNTKLMNWDSLCTAENHSKHLEGFTLSPNDLPECFDPYDAVTGDFLQPV